MNPEACNFDSMATLDDGECAFPDACGICGGPGAIYECGCVDLVDGECNCEGDLYDVCGVCGGDNSTCTGCTYETACNYDPDAVILDLSSCEFGTCPGCTDPNALNYNPTVSEDDGSCIYPTCGVFISEYAEGSGQNKYLELYNPTSSPIFLDDYTFGNCSNGCDALGSASTITGNVDFWTFNFPSGDSIVPGGNYIVAHPSADPIILASADMTSLS